MKILIAFLLLTGISVSFKRAADHKAITPKISQRNTIGSLKHKAGVVKNIGSHEKPVYIIRYQEGFMNLVANNIPVAFQKDGLPIEFSGDLKEMNPMEDEEGLYFVVNSIKQTH